MSGLGTSPFMLFTVPVREDKRALIPAVTHVDGTARVQTVSRYPNARFWEVISEFGQITEFRCCSTRPSTSGTSRSSALRGRVELFPFDRDRLRRAGGLLGREEGSSEDVANGPRDRCRGIRRVARGQRAGRGPLAGRAASTVQGIANASRGCVTGSRPDRLREGESIVRAMGAPSRLSLRGAAGSACATRASRGGERRRDAERLGRPPRPPACGRPSLQQHGGLRAALPVETT